MKLESTMKELHYIKKTHTYISMELCKGLNHVESMHVYYRSVDSQLRTKNVQVKVSKQTDCTTPKNTTPTSSQKDHAAKHSRCS